MPTQPGLLLVDGHAHLHDPVPVTVFLSAARDHFRRASSRVIPPGELRAVLCLADFPNAEGFTRLQEVSAGQAPDNPWSRTDLDAASLAFRASDGDELWLIAGHQVVTAERLEVVAIGTTTPPTSGMPLNETIAQVREFGALPVLPWGVGKWLGRRGTLVSAAMENFGRDLPLGDNGGRPSGWRPRLLARARNLGVPVIPGSDPLPIAEDQLRNGCFGLTLEGERPGDEPSAWLRQRLATPHPRDAILGRPLTFVRFISRQIRLRQKSSQRGSSLGATS